MLIRIAYWKQNYGGDSNKWSGSRLSVQTVRLPKEIYGESYWMLAKGMVILCDLCLSFFSIWVKSALLRVTGNTRVCICKGLGRRYGTGMIQSWQFVISVSPSQFVGFHFLLWLNDFWNFRSSLVEYIFKGLNFNLKPLKVLWKGTRNTLLVFLWIFITIF